MADITVLNNADETITDNYDQIVYIYQADAGQRELVSNREILLDREIIGAIREVFQNRELL